MFGLFDKAKIEIIVDPKLPLMEDIVNCKIIVYPKSKARLRKIEIALICTETAISRGTTDTRYRKDIYRDVRVPTKDFSIDPLHPLEFEEEFELPPFTTPTIKTYNHYVEWYIYVRLDVPWWPDTRVIKPIYVMPYILLKNEF